MLEIICKRFRRPEEVYGQDTTAMGKYSRGDVWFPCWFSKRATRRASGAARTHVKVRGGRWDPLTRSDCRSECGKRREASRVDVEVKDTATNLQHYRCVPPGRETAAERLL